MGYRERLPCPALRAHVECIWQSPAERAARPHRVLPDGSMDVIFALGEGASEGLVIGVMTEAILASSGGASLLGVRFHPGEAFALLGVAAPELRDGQAPLVGVWGSEGRALAERLAAEPTAEGQVAALTRALLERLGRARPADPRLRAAVGEIQKNRGAVDVGALARRVGLSERQLERVFDERVGLGPKGLARVERLKGWLRLAEGAREQSRARLAAEAGFADQAHLIREVKKLCGTTPGRLLAERGRAVSDLFNAVGDVRPTLAGP